jgi:hypothetical protein
MSSSSSSDNSAFSQSHRPGHMGRRALGTSPPPPVWRCQCHAWYNFVNVNCCTSSPCLFTWIIVIGTLLLSGWYWSYASHHHLYDGDPHRQLDVYLSILWTISYVASLAMIVYGLVLTRQQGVLDALTLSSVQQGEIVYRNAPYSVRLYKHLYPCDATVQVIPDPDPEPPTNSAALVAGQRVFESTFALELFNNYMVVLVVERIPQYSWRATWASQLKTPAVQALYDRTRRDLPEYLREWLRVHRVVDDRPPGSRPLPHESEPESTCESDDLSVHRSRYEPVFSRPLGCCCRSYLPERAVGCSGLRRRQARNGCQTRVCDCGASTWVFPAITLAAVSLVVAIIGSYWYWQDAAYRFYPVPAPDGARDVLAGALASSPLAAAVTTDSGIQSERRAMLYIRALGIYFGFVLFLAVLSGVLQTIQVMQTAIHNGFGGLQARLRENLPYSYRMWRETTTTAADDSGSQSVEAFSPPEGEDSLKQLLFESTWMDALFQRCESVILGVAQIDRGDWHYMERCFSQPRINWGWKNKRYRRDIIARDFIDCHFYRPELLDDWDPPTT